MNNSFCVLFRSHFIIGILYKSCNQWSYIGLNHLVYTWFCHGSVSCQPYYRGSDSISHQSLRDLWQINWYWDRLFTENFSVSLSVSFHHSYRIIHLSITDIICQQLTASSNMTKKNYLFHGERGVLWLFHRPLFTYNVHVTFSSVVQDISLYDICIVPSSVTMFCCFGSV
jgi:hypothetical protein